MESLSFLSSGAKTYKAAGRKRAIAIPKETPASVAACRHRLNIRCEQYARYGDWMPRTSFLRL